jgi:hypothetical protein
MRPTFRYEGQGIAVEDFPVAVTAKDEPGFVRTLTLRAMKPLEPLYFRAALADKIDEKDGVFHIGEKVTMKFPGAKALLRVSEGKTELLVPIIFAGQQAKIVQEISW